MNAKDIRQMLDDPEIVAAILAEHRSRSWDDLRLTSEIKQRYRFSRKLSCGLKAGIVQRELGSALGEPVSNEFKTRVSLVMERLGAPRCHLDSPAKTLSYRGLERRRLVNLTPSAEVDPTTPVQAPPGVPPGPPSGLSGV